MTILIRHPGTVGAAPPDPSPAAEAPVLGSALAHLLARDGELPERWRTPAFAKAVEAARAAGAAGVEGPMTAEPGIDFGTAARRLARDPVVVAAAVRHLERVEHRRLPAWPELVRRGLPGRPTPLDTALWFG